MQARFLLREATKSAHARVDARFGVLDLTCAEDYLRFLDFQSAAVPACEAALSRFGAGVLLPDWADRLRSNALAADIGALRESHAPAPAPRAVETPASPASAFGMLYVLEGSRLGGAMLARRVAASEDARVRGATRFLRHGEGRPFWRDFVAALDASVVAETDIHAAVASAIATFAVFDA